MITMGRSTRKQGKKMELDGDAGLMEGSKKASLQTGNHMDIAEKFSKMGAILKEYGNMAGEMGRENM
jgi:hypothetical protein